MTRVYKDSSSLDLEVRFTTFGNASNGDQKLGQYIEGKPGGLFSKRVAGAIEFDFRAIGNEAWLGVSRQGVVLHELGHALGYKHMVNSNNSIMSYSNSARNNFIETEVDALIGAYK